MCALRSWSAHPTPIGPRRCCSCMAIPAPVPDSAPVDEPHPVGSNPLIQPAASPGAPGGSASRRRPRPSWANSGTISHSGFGLAELARPGLVKRIGVGPTRKSGEMHHRAFCRVGIVNAAPIRSCPSGSCGSRRVPAPRLGGAAHPAPGTTPTAPVFHDRHYILGRDHDGSWSHSRLSSGRLRADRFVETGGGP
jgi:hypothetical protein